MNREAISKAQSDISRVCKALEEFLLEKNRRYGNSAMEPVRAFSKANAGEQILIRMDDKLSRIINSDEPRKNDFVDLLGYIVLYMVHREWLDFKDQID